MKRLFDLVLALFGLLVSAPFMALVALAIKIDTPGRVFFSQRRLGRGGETFNIYKFRKFPDAWGDQGSGVTVAGDARMTRVGRILERTKLDELPQLWNIIKGDMSFVGPRPESLRFAELFEGEYARVHDYMPGIFGPNQVAHRNESAMYPPDCDPEDFYRKELFPAKAERDLAYFPRADLATDIGWIVKGVWCSLAGTINWRRLFISVLPRAMLDIAAIEIAWVLANLIRFEGLPPDRHWGTLLTGTWLIPVIVIVVKLTSGSYRQPMRYFSIRNAARLVVGTVVGWSLAYLALLGAFHRGASFSLAPLGILLTLPLTLTPRLIWREMKRRRARQFNGNHSRAVIAVYGAGHRGEALAHLMDQGFPGVALAGFFDDNESELQGHEIGGHPVLGTERDLTTVHAVHKLDQLWLSFQPEPHKRRRLENWCDQNGVQLVILPEIGPFDRLRVSDGVET
jgi:lipopolysaccharide/colanic/teichoic acid biosynthesis glycosyltransferase